MFDNNFAVNGQKVNISNRYLLILLCVIEILVFCIIIICL